MKVTVEQAIAKEEEMMYTDYHIHAGVERKAVAKEWDRRRYDTMFAGYASTKIETAYINADGIIVCA